jgi:hypothetical protein
MAIFATPVRAGTSETRTPGSSITRRTLALTANRET